MYVFPQEYCPSATVTEATLQVINGELVTLSLRLCVKPQKTAVNTRQRYFLCNLPRVQKQSNPHVLIRCGGEKFN